MRTVPINEAKDRFSALLQMVEGGEEVVITRHGKKIARLIRESEGTSTESERERARAEALARLQAFQSCIGPDADYQPGDWKNYRDEGRR